MGGEEAGIGATPSQQPHSRAPQQPGPSIDPLDGAASFRVAPDQWGRPVAVWFHLADFGADPRFVREGDLWVARIPRPPVNRLEYLIEIEYPDGNRSLVPDPANPRRSRGVFGDHSLIEWPEYRLPWWMAVADATQAQARHEALVGWSGRSREGVASVQRPRARVDLADGRRNVLSPGEPVGWFVAQEGTDASIVDPRAEVVASGRLHIPDDSHPGEPLPLLVVHDGPEYADLGQLLRYLAVLARVDRRLRSRVLLLAPVERDRSYSASPAYARALVGQLLPEVRATVRTIGPVVGMGASLGGLAMLHAALTYPGAFGGLFCQSGSFFLPRTDDQEKGYRFYNRIVRFVQTVDVDPGRLAGLRVSLTCGTGEENLANNRDLARRLARSGVPVTMIENPDGHNYTGWRDSLDPGLRDLLLALWGNVAARSGNGAIEASN